MTIASTTNRNTYAGTGSAGPFTFNFRIFAATDLRVIRRSSLGLETVLTNAVDYTVPAASVGTATGTLTLTTALAVGETLVIRRVLPLTQATDLANQGTYFPKNIEDQFDRLVAIDQQQQDAIDRSLQLDESYAAGSYDLKFKPGTAGQVLGLASDGTTMQFLDGAPTPSTAFLSGTGSPEGVITAAVSSIYRQTDGLNGRNLWKKRSGSGNTGWELIPSNHGVFFVGDYGALPSASAATNRAAIQAAMDAMPVNGGILLFDYGNYNVDAALVIPNADANYLKPIRFVGQTSDMSNYYSTSITLTATTVPLFQGRGAGGAETRRFVGSFENIALVGPGSGTTADGINIYLPTGFSMNNVAVSGFRRGLYLHSYWYYSKIEFCRFWNNNIGIFGSASAAPVANGAGIRYCSFSGNVNHINLDYFGENIYIEGNWFESATGDEVVLSNGRHVICRGNYFEFGTGNALQFTSETIAGQNCTVVFEDNFVECGGAAGDGGIVNIISSSTNHNVDVYLKGNNVAVQTADAVPTHLVSANQTSIRIHAPGDGATYRTTATYRALTLQSGGTTMRADGQIKFPATQNASSDANTLDDYEEGTWTPGLQFGGAAVGMTFSAQQGSYTKIGNRVMVSAIMTLSAKGSSTGAARITGLPFTIANANDAYAPVSLRLISVTFTGQAQGYGVVGGTAIQLEKITEAGAATDLDDTNFGNASGIIIQMTYRV